MRRSSAAAAFAGLLLAGAACHVLAEERRVVGLLELPGVFGTRDSNGPPGLTPPARIEPVSLHARPNAASAVVGEIAGLDSVVAEELDYEAPAAVAYGRARGWTLVRSGGTFGWVSPQSAGRFHPLSELVESGLTFLTVQWDGALYAGPDASRIAARFESGDRKDVRVVRRAGSWVEVEVLEPGRCEGRDAKVLGRGWVPLYGRDGKRNLWFHPRGC